MIKQPYNATEALSVGKQVDVTQDLLSDFVFRHKAVSIATESPGAELLDYAEVLL